MRPEDPHKLTDQEYEYAFGQLSPRLRTLSRKKRTKRVVKHAKRLSSLIKSMTKEEAKELLTKIRKDEI